MAFMAMRGGTRAGHGAARCGRSLVAGFVAADYHAAPEGCRPMSPVHTPRCYALLLIALMPAVACAAAQPAAIEVAALTGAGDATAARVVRGELNGHFVALAPPLLRAPQERAAWYRVRLAADWHGAGPPLLAIAGDTRARAVVYAPPVYAARMVFPSSADLDPRFSRHALVFELPRDLRAGQAVYLALGAPGQSQPMRARVVAYDDYQAEDLGRVRLSVFFVSIQAAMLLVILCFWLVLRDRVFLYFIAYVAAQLAYELASTGELYALPGAAALAPLGFHPGQFAAIVSAALSISFILEFAELSRHVPRLARALAAMRWPYLAFAIVLWLPPLQPDRWLPNAVNAMLVVSTSTALLAGWRAWRHGSRPAGFFLISWLPLLCLTVLRVAQLIFGLPLPAWLEYGFPASMAYAAVVITVGLADRTLQARHERDLAHRLAEFDPLTGVLNRRAILVRLHVAYADARQTRRALAVLFLDLDHFKRINDSHGHAAGDNVLAVVAAAMQAELRELDWLGRYGGEEFVAVLPDAPELVARTIAERIRQRTADLRIVHGDVEVRLTVSVGVALLDATTPTVEALIEHADIALYRAKAQGRNRVVHYLPGEAVADAASGRHR
jgi:diguanylate cyclase (GGDEF)-like protein